MAGCFGGDGKLERWKKWISWWIWRADNVRTRQSGGSGLGLAIAKELIEAQGGQIRARNLVQGGLAVVISFG